MIGWIFIISFIGHSFKQHVILILAAATKALVTSLNFMSRRAEKTEIKRVQETRSEREGELQSLSP